VKAGVKMESKGRCERWRVAGKHEDQQRRVKNEDGEN
jgi:hypothetical protein